jgi:hypothetical protein
MGHARLHRTAGVLLSAPCVAFECALLVHSHFLNMAASMVLLLVGRRVDPVAFDPCSAVVVRRDVSAHVRCSVLDRCSAVLHAGAAAV